MPDSVLLPIPIPSLPRIHSFNGIDTILTDFDNFLEEHITLLVLGSFENSTVLMENAHQLCVQDGAHPKQRILWVNDIDQLSALRTKLEADIKEAFPEKEVDFNNIRALSLVPKTKKIAYLIYIDPSKSPDPKDKRKKLSSFQMSRAFNAAIKAIPNPDNQDN